jgi:hypothetical protein
MTTTDLHLDPHRDSISCMTIEKGLEFIMSHFDDSEPMWPRMISAWRIGGEHPQKLVNSEQEALKWYRAANLLDCRISAYPKYTDNYINGTGIAHPLYCM